jgi:hypothetical protein
LADERFSLGYGTGINKYTQSDLQLLGQRNAIRFSPWKAYLDGVKNETFAGHIVDWAKLLDAKTGTPINPRYKDRTKLSPQQAKDKFGINIDREVSAGEAQFIADKDLEEQQRQAVLSRINPYGLFGSYSKSIAQFAGAMTDPTMLVTGALVRGGVWGVQALHAANIIKAGKAVRMAGFLAQGGVKAAFARGALEGTLESVALMPMIKYKENQLGREYDWGNLLFDASANILGSSIGEGVFSALGHAFRRGRTKRFANHLDLAEDFSAKGKVYTPHDLEMAYKYDMMEHRKYQARPRDFTYIAAGEVKGNTFFASTKKGATDLSLANTNVVDVSFGKGMILTDNPNLAHNAAARNLDLSSGQVLQIKIGDSKFLDIDLPLPEKMRTGLQDILSKRFGKKFSDEVMGEMSIKKMLKKVDREANAWFDFDSQDAVNNYFKEQGFDGYRFTGGDDIELGNGPYQHNSLFLFDPDPKKMTLETMEEANLYNNEFTPNKTVEEHLKNIETDFASKKSDLTYNPDFDEADIPMLKEDYRVADFTEDLNNLTEEINYLATAEDISALSKQEIDAIKEKTKTRSPEKIREITKAADHCVRNSL